MEVIKEEDVFNYDIKNNMNYSIFINNLNIDKDDTYFKLIQSNIEKGLIKYNKKYCEKYLFWIKNNL